MLTVKLQNKGTGRTTIVECASVDITSKGSGFVLDADATDGKRSFTVDDGGDYNVAFIENAQGATTQIVRPMNGHGNDQRPRQRVS